MDYPFYAHTATLTNVNAGGSYENLPISHTTGLTLVVRASTTGVFIGAGPAFALPVGTSPSGGFELLPNKEYTIRIARRVSNQNSNDQSPFAALATGSTARLSWYVTEND